MKNGRDDDPPRDIPVGSGASDLMSLFAPPATVPPASVPSPSRPALPTINSGIILRSENDDTVISTQLDGTRDRDIASYSIHARDPIVTQDDGDDESDDDVTPTIRRINNSVGQGEKSPLIQKDYGSIKGHSNREDCDDGREFFLKIKAKKSAATAQHRHHTNPSGAKRQNGNITSSAKEDDGKCTALFCRESAVLKQLQSLMSPLASMSTWMGGIMFVLYHVVFAMANGGSIIRPYSGTSMLGDMARYTTVGILASCPFLVFSLSDNARKNRTGIPAMYPSADLFLAPFLAEAAAVIDKCITDDWKAGILTLDGTEEGIELKLTRLWFGSFALVVSFGMFASGALLILASKIKLANLGTYLPYGVLCGFFSAVGVLMWKLAITIDTPSSGHDDTTWKTILVHHLPSLSVGIAMNQLGPKHPFFVTGLILLIISAFYMTMYIMNISLEEAQHAGWFYSHEELKSSSFSVPSVSANATIEDQNRTKDDTSSSWMDQMLPPLPLGIWFAILELDVYWKAVFQASKNMIALAILYLLRASIHAAALKKNVHNLVRRVPLKHKPEVGTNKDAAKIIEKTSDVLARSPPRHRRKVSMDSVASGLLFAFDGANQLAQSLRNEVQIVNMSLADRQYLRGKCHSSPRRQLQNRTQSIGSHTTAVVGNLTSIKPDLPLPSPVSPSSKPPVPPQNPIRSDPINIGSANDEEIGLLLPPSLQREVSALTQRTTASVRSSYFPSPEKTKEISIGSVVSTGGDYSVSLKGDAKGEISAKDVDTMDYEEIRAPSSDMTLEEIFVKYGYGLFVTAGCGGFGCCPTIATSNTMYAVGAGAAAPQYLSVFLLLVAFYFSGFELVRFIPKAAFSSLLVLGAVDNFMNWFIRPISKMASFTEWSVVPFIAMLSLFVGFLKAVFLGIGVSTFLFVADFFRVGVVKYDASGLEIRSRIERSLGQSIWLDDNGDYLRVIVLQNYLFFGNASSLFRYIETMFEEIPLAESRRLGFPIPPIPIVLVLDLSLITGMDTSTVDVFLDIYRMCKRSDCKLYLCGLSPRIKKTFASGGMKPDSKGPKKSRTLLYFSDLDHGLGRAEDVLIDMKMGGFANQSLFRLEKGSSGFHVALQHIDQLHSMDMGDGLLPLEPYTKMVTLKQGELLFEQDGGVIADDDHGLFFIESGMVRVDDDSAGRTNTRTGGSLRRISLFTKGNDNTLNGKHARLDTAAQRAALTKLTGSKSARQPNNMRIATIGPGWVIGTNEFATGQHWQNKFKAITNVKMYHLRFSDLTKLEEEDPALVLRLYKMLTLIMARKEEDTIAHLSTLHSILSSPAYSEPIRRLSALSQQGGDTR